MDIGVPLEGGYWVNESVARAVELIHETYPDLEVKWLPREDRSKESTEPAFAICYRLTGDVAFYVKDETEMNPSILDRIWAADNTKNAERNAKKLEDFSNKRR